MHFNHLNDLKFVLLVRTQLQNLTYFFLYFPYNLYVRTIKFASTDTIFFRFLYLTFTAAVKSLLSFTFQIYVICKIGMQTILQLIHK